ncbi:Wzz/FepE/Etk N-terminal domain-containing protein [Miltoncostaea marina]|uniref:Wzz/FepE/Etk N-terminal domain-containing protein n=1 Tax=Miltoncostaea marina TaxID=2843215 RepID=UPI001C3D61FE|nr:Wzz/FepE/Etk N-terminal domain-containing protein [Miltoncostaea marina]
MDREITLRDYGRVLWSGRWLILVATVAAAVVGLLLTFATTTTYRATAELFVGQATTVSGTPVSTPGTNPALVSTVLAGDELVRRVAEEIGVRPGRVRRGVDLTAPRAPGGSVGNLPTVVTVTFTDEDRDVALRGANAYAEAILAEADEGFEVIISNYRQGVEQAERDVERLQRDIARYTRQLAEAPGGDRQLALQALLQSAGQQLQIANTELTTQKLNLVKENQFQPKIISLASDPSSSGSLPNRARSVVLAAVIGFVIGVIVTFVWRGSPAGRAGRE